MRRSGARGFTLIEMMISLACVALIATVALPFSEHLVQRRKEAELRSALREIRSALDAYRQAAEEGRIRRSAAESGYPPELSVLATGVNDITQPDGRRMYFMRRIPRDPFHSDPTTPAHQTWGLRSYESPPDAPREGRDVFDVYSRAAGAGLNGIPFREW